MSELLRTLDLAIDAQRAAAGALRASLAALAGVRPSVAAIIADVRARGDAVVAELTRKYDGAQLGDDELFLPANEWVSLAARCPPAVQEALELACARVHAFHAPQLPKTYEVGLPGGGRLRSLILPLERAACYVPGGRAAYPSTVIMTSTLARLAGVPEIIVTTPPRLDGSILPEVAAAARIAGASRILRAGGAQAIAALALGTQSVPRVDVIVGPGNVYVTEAKRQLSGEVRIDSLAGPTELVVVADDSADPRHVAADLISQAEHDPLALSVLVTWSRLLSNAVTAAVADELLAHPNKVAEEALRARGAVVLAGSRELALNFADDLAPEHLELIVDDAASALAHVPRAAAVFVGPWSPVAVGDYLAGPNHTLPTSGTARYSSPLSTTDFVRRQNVIEYGPQQLASDAEPIAALAHAEGLHGHAWSVEVRRGPGAAR